MITISETIHSSKIGRLEPTYVRYHVKGLKPVAFEPIHLGKRLILPWQQRVRPQVAALYATNRSPRDRMRHDDRWRGRKARTVRYTAIDPRWR